jgi:hypothetical protein
VFVCLSLVLYLLFAVPAAPQAGVPWVPALALVLVFGILLCFVLSFLAALLDRLRIPLLLAVAGGLYVTYSLFGVDYYYDTPPRNTPAVVASNSPDAVFERWRTHHPDDTVLTVVTASGGGIRAAGWTAEVLTRLDEASDGAFGRSLLLISSVSGGSVGAMYYVDRYGEGEGARTHIRRESTRSSLYGTAWGLVYGDVWRWLPFGGNRDRGRALERIWAQRLATDSTTIWDWWRDDNAWRPFHIHNATIAETGDRMLLAAVDSVGDANTFSGLYPENDLRVATAARLSATFPYVSPLARPRVRNGVPESTAYRLGDGGYFDNHGVATAIDVLNDVLDSNRGIKHVLFVQVRSSVAEERNARFTVEGRTPSSARSLRFFACDQPRN